VEHIVVHSSNNVAAVDADQQFGHSSFVDAAITKKLQYLYQSQNLVIIIICELVISLLWK